MFYRDLNIPSIIEVGSGTINKLSSILKQNHIYFEDKILFTQKSLYDTYKISLDFSQFSEIIFVDGGSFEEALTIELKHIYIHEPLFVAFGGGSVVDFVKIYSHNLKRPYISIPSALSNDAIYSPIARLNKRGRKKSFGVNAPIGIIVDIDVIRESPEILLLSGVGDLISNLSALQDCKLAIKDKNEAIDSFAMTLSQLGANAILPYTKTDIRSDDFIEHLAIGLIVSGMAMVMDGTSRPASGAEHLISHAIDEYFPEKATLHGIQVAWAQLILEKEIRKNPLMYSKIDSFFNRIGLVESINKLIPFTEEDFYQLIPYAKKIRKRYTILDTLDM